MDVVFTVVVKVSWSVGLQLYDQCPYKKKVTWIHTEGGCYSRMESDVLASRAAPEIPDKHQKLGDRPETGASLESLEPTPLTALILDNIFVISS